MKTRNLSILIPSIIIFSFSVKSNASETVNLGQRIASSAEIIDYFAPAKIERPSRVRGIRLLDNQAPEHRSRSLSLQVNFKYNSHELSEFAKDQLTPVGVALASQELASISFLLEGHTDAKGSASYNQHLSERRANEVKQFFMERYGVESDRVSALGRGEHQLLARSNPYSGVNRRVTVTANY